MVAQEQENMGGFSNKMNVLGVHREDTMLYTGTIPFIWSFDIYLQQLGESEKRWFATAHLTAQGATTVIFRSETVEVFPNTVTAIPFPGSQNRPTLASTYYMQSCEMSGGGDPNANCIYVQLIPAQIVGFAPTIVIVDTKIQPNWIIGAREIILTDPPILAEEKAHVIEESLG